MTSPRLRTPSVLLLAAGVAFAVWAYAPSLSGGFLWDDGGHVTRPSLRGVDGLARIWSEPGATQQLYPLLHTAFWGLHRAFGDEPFGYRVVNLVLHLVAGVLAWRVLARLRVPGAAFVAGAFLVHPVHVETVAWISELKNTLSGVLYLGALLAWVRYDGLGEEEDGRERPGRLYALALGLFVLALLSKTVTATWPAVVLVLAWWKRGRIDARRDVLPLAPFLALGIAAALVTAWAETALIGAGAEVDFTWAERLAIAGRAPWHYARTLVWPADLSFFYPRWPLDASAWAWPVATVLALGALWALRARIGRAPLAAALAFGGTLVPVLGFLDVYPFRYAYAADHFQYLASLAALALLGGGAATLCARVGPRTVCGAAGVVLLGLLAWRTSERAQVFTSEERLWRDTLERNPGSAAAHNNLGLVLAASGRLDEALAEYERSIELRPDDPAAYLNRGNAYGLAGRHDAAIESIRASLERGPDRPNTWTSLANELFATGRVAEAEEACREALELDPRFGPAWFNLSAIRHRLGRLDEATDACLRAIEVSPPSPEPWHNLGVVELARGRTDAALAAFRRAVELDPGHAAASVELARLLAARGEVEAALGALERAEAPDALLLRARLAGQLGRNELAARDLARALELRPDDVEALARLAWIRATDAALADGAEALRLAEAAVARGGEQPGLLNVLAAALARAGDTARAVEVAERAEGDARAAGQTALAAAIAVRAAVYREGRPLTE